MNVISPVRGLSGFQKVGSHSLTRLFFLQGYGMTSKHFVNIEVN